MGALGTVIKGAATAATTVVNPIAGAVLGLINIGKSIFGNSANKQAEKQKELTEHSAKLNYEYGEKAAENAYERQIGMYENYLSPEQQIASQMAGLQANDLNVGLMYGGSGPGGSGSASTAPQGSGASGQQAASRAAIEANRLQSLAIASQIAKTSAETKNIEKDTEVKDVEANNIKADTGLKGVQSAVAAANVGLIMEQTGNAKLAGEGQRLQNDFDKIRNEIASATKDLQIEKITYETDHAIYIANKLIEEVNGLKIDNDIKIRTRENIIRSVAANVENTIADTMTKITQSVLNTEQAEAIGDWIKIAVSGQQIEMIKIQNDMAKFGLTMDNAKAERTMALITTLINGITHMTSAGIIANRPMPMPTPTQTMYDYGDYRYWMKNK